MSGTFSMQDYTGTDASLEEAQSLVGTILARLGHNNVQYTQEILLTSKTLPLDHSDLKFFKENHVGVYEFKGKDRCDSFNSAVQRMKLHKKIVLTGHETRDEITRMFHEYQDKLQDEDFIKILQTHNGTIYTSDKKCDDGILTKCVKGAHWLTELYTDLYKGIMPWHRKKPRVGGRRTNKMKMRKFRPRTRRNRSRRERRK